MCSLSFIFFFNDTATTEIYTLSLHDALPICRVSTSGAARPSPGRGSRGSLKGVSLGQLLQLDALVVQLERLARDLVSEGVQGRGGVLRRPGSAQVPARDLVALLVEEDDRDVAAVEGSLRDRQPPLEEARVACEAAAQDQRAVLDSPRKEARRIRP